MRYAGEPFYCVLVHGLQKVFRGHAGLTLFGAEKKPEKFSIFKGKGRW